MLLEILATKAVEYFVLQVTGGALEKLGADAKDYLQTLVGVMYSRFAARKEIQEAKQNPEGLKAVIMEEIPKNVAFREELESVVEKLVAIEGNQNSGTVNQVSTGSGSNINAPQNTGYIAGGNQYFRG
jgi:transcriptional accessory protein Tex/SPT6